MRLLPRVIRLTTIALVTGALLVPAAPVFAADTAPAQDETSRSVSDHRDPLRLDASAHTRSSARSSILKWKQKRLYYYETIPTKWDWSLSKAVSKWNASGGRIKLTRTIHRSKAHVKISYGNTRGAAGMATIGSTRGAYVHLSRAYAAYDSADPWRRIAVMAIFTHELGHVFGFGHTTAKCSLMRSVLDVSACYLPPTSPPGYHKCRTIDAPLLRKFIRRYGGRAHLPKATWCLIDPMPSALTGVSFSGGVDSPVTVRWAPPATVPVGSKVEIRMWPGEECTETPSWADTVLVDPTALQWQDDGAWTSESFCFRARLINRFGASRAAVVSPMSRWMQSAAEPVAAEPVAATP